MGFLLLLTGAGGFAAIAATLFMMGMSQGGEADVGSYLCASYFGMRSFSTLSGCFSAAGALGNVIAGATFSILLDRPNGYDLLLLGGFVSFALTASLFLLALALRVPRFRATPLPA